MENLSYWPLVICLYQECATLERYQRQLEQWEQWLDGQQPFALLRIYTTPESLILPEGCAAFGKAWLLRNQPQLQQWTLGIATVILPEQDYARLKKIQLEKALGIPSSTHPSWDEAIAWLQTEIFAPRGIPMPAIPVPALPS